jgi:ParB family transcriptional regulator, chromosome partitioning protein
MVARKGGLGRSLDSLIPTNQNQINSNSGEMVATRDEVDINFIHPNPKQPRTIFNEDELTELALSIKEVGVLQPPVVRKINDSKYELIMGERRLRASKLAGLKTIPIIIRQTQENELLREALLENIHRSQLNPLEEGSAYQNLINDFNYTHDELAKKVGKSRSAITNTLRLLNLPASVQRKVAAGVISAGHARALLSLTDSNQIEKMANRIVSEGLSVRAVEELVITTSPNNSNQNNNTRNNGKKILKEVSDKLSDLLDTRVTVEDGKSKGKIIIEFANYEDLNRIIKVIE